MLNLIKANVYKMLKSVSTYVLLAFMLGFTLINLITYSVFDDFGATLVSSLTSISSNFGLLVPIILILSICQDFSFGTVRNKVIAGYSKTKIYFAQFICSYIFGILMFLIYVITNFTLASVISNATKNIAIEKLVLNVALSSLVYSVVIVATFFYSMILQKTGKCILAQLGTIIGLAIIVPFALLIKGDVAVFLSMLNPVAQSSFTMMMNLSTKELLTIVISDAIYIVALLIGGLFIFKNKDLK